ncbi:MAG: hypothetical protein H6592_09600 [Flavobacteriales bacterium]|nr:hypothetical protein [Flavobacteriales bacterium]
MATVNEPFRCTTALFAQRVWSAPAFAVGAGVKDTSMLSATALHTPLPVEVNLIHTEPAVRSAALGV